MQKLIQEELDLIRQLESSTLTSKERKVTETKLDSTREALESNGWNSMEIVYSYLKHHPNRRTWTQTYTGKGYTNPQFLVSGLMTPDSPLKSILLYHGVGVGKTCAAIAAASDYKEENSIIVLTPSQTLVKNWKEEFIGRNHCGRHIWNIPDETWKQMTMRKRLNVLHSHTQIMGYLTFANRVESMMETFIKADTTITKEYALIRAVRTLCNHKMIIMDEIHNTRQQSGSSKTQEEVKKIRPVLEAIARYAKQSKFVLLSATPMYNEVSELEWIVNLLRLNQGLSPMTNGKWYNAKESNWKTPISQSKDYVIQKIRGFISYIRGENPFTFPRRLYPSPTRFSIRNEGGLSLIESKMSEDMRTAIQNITKDSKDYFATQTIQNLLSVQTKIDHDDNAWSPDIAKTWSPKLWTAWTALKDSVGPVFMYSQYLSHGLYEMAKILEEMGWIRVGGDNYLSKGRIIDPYCWANKCRRSEIVSKPESERKPFVQAKYVLLDGTSTNIYSMLDLVNESANRKGDKCAVLLGSRVIEVGVSLKRFRQVHIMEPWFHLNSMEQAMGRAIRNRSHIDLPESERNITIFIHCVTDDTHITSDLMMYQKSIEKMSMMSQVTSFIAKHAIDCDIQKNMNYIRDMQTMKVSDSYGSEREIQKGDSDFSARCGYGVCEIKCSSNTSQKPTDAPENTELNALYSSIQSQNVFPTNRDILIERLPAVIRGLSAVDIETVCESLGISESLAQNVLDTFVSQNKTILHNNGLKYYLQKIGETYVSSLYPQRLLPIENSGIVPVKEVITDIKMNTLRMPMKKIEAKVIKTDKVDTLDKVDEVDKVKTVSKDVDIVGLLNALDKQLKMVEGLTPMRKSIEQKGSLQVSKLDSDKAIRQQAAYQRYIGYADDRDMGEKQIARRELYPSIVVTFIEHLSPNDRDGLLRHLIETQNSEIDIDNKYTYMYIRDALSEDGLGLDVVPFLMQYERHVKPYLPEDVAESINASTKALNVYAHTEKNKVTICILLEDNITWHSLQSSVVLEWKEALKPKVIAKLKREKESKLWIDAWIDSDTHEFSLRIPRKDPLGENPVSKKAQVLGGLCGQALFVKNVEELVRIIEQLTGISYKAFSKRVEIAGKTFPSGIYWPSGSGDALKKSFYLGGVNKKTSKTSTGASLCEELEYILRIITYAGSHHPMSKWITFSSSLEHSIYKIETEKR